MAPCCQNVVTPKMIKEGKVSIGDRIEFTSGSYSELSPAHAAAAETQTTAAKASATEPPVQAASTEPAAHTPAPESAPVMAQTATAAAAAAPFMSDQQQAPMQQQIPMQQQSPIQQQNTVPPYFGQNAQLYQPLRNDSTRAVNTIPFSDMTSYMNGVSLNGNSESPSIITPKSPLTPDGYMEEIDGDSVQAFNGFLRTQMGRYMRIEQLIGSNTIEDRFGFLVGVGSNFIILQEITSGNIMVLDIFSIRLTYVYYSAPVVPNL